MPIETIEFNEVSYPAFQSRGNAARWVMPFAQELCRGNGVDIGCNRLAWAMPNAQMVDPIIDGQTAMSFAADDLDFIFSSHMLEHLGGNWMTCLDYWLTKIKTGGIIFLYLPHKSQEYWLPRNNRKHVHSFSGEEITEYLRSLGHKVFCSGVDLNNSFVVVCERVDQVEFKMGDAYIKSVKDAQENLDRTKRTADILESRTKPRATRAFSLNEQNNTNGYISYEIEGDDLVNEYDNDFKNLKSNYEPLSISYYNKQHEIFLKYKKFAKRIDNPLDIDTFTNSIKEDRLKMTKGERVEADYFQTENGDVIWYNGKRFTL